MTDLLQRAALLREEQRVEEALEAFRAAALLSPNDPNARFGLAQMSFECWRPAADLFAALRKQYPDHLALIRSHALALAAEGENAAAQALLETKLSTLPGWLDGHKILTTMRFTNGEGDGFDRSYALACAKEPMDAALRLAWFQHHATLKDWKQAGIILAAARAATPEHRGLALAQLFLASESGVERENAALFDAYSNLGDPGLDLCRVRHHLRGGDPTRAEAIALRHIRGATARMFWPYLSLCWRLTDDERGQWLDGVSLYTKVSDLNFTARELSDLTQTLRSLHRMKAPYPEQSVRGGTQTDRQLFFHPDTTIQAVREKIATAVQTYVAELPKADISHPLLGRPRDQPPRFEGSWSVRLTGQGHHASHTHVMGWISSAFYVSLPDSLSQSPAGCLTLGTPPPELGLSLTPRKHIEPKAGRLVLFPSTLWHATEPFDKGERLTIAFDIKVPHTQPGDI
ncbi:MAG: putative 2OG-Fe(II) oxygenase [Sphingorhabdus sp.]